MWHQKYFVNMLGHRLSLTGFMRGRVLAYNPSTVPNSKTTLARFPRFYIAQAERLGLDSAEILAQAGLKQSELDEPDARIRVAKVLEIWRAMVDMRDDPGLGIQIGSAMRARDGGLVGYLMQHSHTLGAALERLVRFGHILDETAVPALEVRRGVAEYSVRPLPELMSSLKRLADCDLAAVLAVARDITGHDLEPVEVHFPYPRQDEDLGAHVGFFRCRLEFDQPLARLVFKTSDLDLPTHAADEGLVRYLEGYAEQVLETLVPQGTLSDRVERALWAGLKEGEVSLEWTASHLAISARTLQRRLRDDGTSFNELRDRFRHEMAARLLAQPDLAIYEVALLLGYSEPSTFYRAFRRWTGTSPRQYREHLES